MSKVGEALGVTFVENPDSCSELAVLEWRATLRDNNWCGKVLIQCASDQDVMTFHKDFHGFGVCIGGLVRSIDISSPSDTKLAAGHSKLHAASATAS